MATRRKTRSVTAIEELYRENEDDSITETASDTVDAENEEAESSHVSETDADEDETDGESEESEESTAAQTTELSVQPVKPLLVRRLATPTLRINLRTIIREFLKVRDLPEDFDIRDEFVDNKISPQKLCNLRPSSLDRKTFYKCLRCDKVICKEHVAKICCECAKNV